MEELRYMQSREIRDNRVAGLAELWQYAGRGQAGAESQVTLTFPLVLADMVRQRQARTGQGG